MILSMNLHLMEPIMRNFHVTATVAPARIDPLCLYLPVGEISGHEVYARDVLRPLY